MMPFINDNKGLALLMTLSMIAVMVPVALAINRSTRETVVQTALCRDDATLHQMAMSGLALGQTLLIQDRAQGAADALTDTWADPAHIEARLQSLPFDHGTLTLSIHDEKAKLQVNALLSVQNRKTFAPKQRVLWIRFLTLAMDAADVSWEARPEDIVNAVKDWLDAGDGEAVSGFNGAESAYYENLPTPYPCANGPIRHIDEMRAIRWITPTLFEGDGTHPGIAPFITVYGSERQDGEHRYAGRININTASLPVLQALMPEGLEDLAASIIAYRDSLEPSESAFVLAEADWYRNAPGCAALELDPALVATSSDTFRLVATASLKHRRLILEAVVERYLEDGVWQCRRLSLVRPSPAKENAREAAL